jgi:outer membrane protein TolC
MARIQLDMEEIRATSSVPRNDLDAPLVGGRDFVRDRLMLDLKAAEEALSVADQDVARERQRFDVGIVSKTALLQAEADAAHARARMQQLAGALDLRQRALRGEIKPDAVAAERQRLELTSRLQEQQRSLELARARLDEARRLFAVGQAAEVDAKRAELQVLEQQLQIQRLQQQLQALGGTKKD